MYLLIMEVVSGAHQTSSDFAVVPFLIFIDSTSTMESTCIGLIQFMFNDDNGPPITYAMLIHALYTASLYVYKVDKTFLQPGVVSMQSKYSGTSSFLIDIAVVCRI